MRYCKVRKHRKGFTLIEMVVSMMIFAIIIASVASLFGIIGYSVRNETESVASARESNAFMYWFVSDVKNASSMAKEGEILFLYSDEGTVIYEFKSSDKSITRNGELIVKGYDYCNITQDTDSELTMRYGIKGESIVEYHLKTQGGSGGIVVDDTEAEDDNS